METKIRTLIKRDGKVQDFSTEKLTAFLTRLTKGLVTSHIDIPSLVDKIEAGLSRDMKTTQLIDLAAETAAYLNVIHPDYSKLAARIVITGIHKQTPKSLLEYAKAIYSFKDDSGRECSLLADKTYNAIVKNAVVLQDMIDYSRDMEYDFFGLKTLEKSYLLRVRGKVSERPQQLLIRVSVGIHGDDMKSVKETYDLMSQKWFTHATPTLFYSGTPKPQMSSCFLLSMTDDSITGIYDTLKRCALISKSAGGIGLSVSNIRAKGSYIRGTNGISNGLVPMLRVFDSTARYVDQGGGKRKGSFAIYLEPWHADVFEFLHLKKNHGKDELRARDLFYALWTPDLFMKRVEADGDWTLMCPAECPGLQDCHGDEFDRLYTKYENEKRGKKTIKARTLWNEIVQSQVETGTPYMLYKDACNLKSNQQNLGTIKSSNLCTEIVEYTSPDEVAVCNLASIALNKFVKDGKFDFNGLVNVTRVATRNLNKIIDLNFYPVKEAENSNLRHRPIGIGVQGLANTFALLKLDYDGKEALELNNRIFEAMYYGACLESMEQSKIDGPYSSFKGSPASRGELQFDLWGVKPTNHDWDTLKKDIVKHGMRNSLLLAPMPTASTSQILGNNETFEAFTSNMYARRVLSGEFICVNKHLVNELVDLGLWTPDVRSRLMADNGSIQRITNIPEAVRRRYRTVWEISQKAIVDLAAGRGPFIDQSQSLNIHIRDPDVNRISSMHFYGWKKGLKTGMYYLRSRPAVNAIKFTVDLDVMKGVENEEKDGLVGEKRNGIEEEKAIVCSLKRRKRVGENQQDYDDEDCLACGS